MSKLDWQTEAWAVHPEASHLRDLANLIDEMVPQPWTCPIDKLLELCKWYYSYHGAGGSLHIVLDDGNLQDTHVDFCIDYSINANFDIIGHYLALLIRTLTEDERVVLYTQLHERSV